MQYTEGYLLDGRYELKRFIGSGTFGEVWVATDKATDLEIAIKVYVSMDEKGLKEFKKEFQISFELNHTNLLHANYLGVNTEDKRPYLVMPYCPDGSVTKYAGQMSETDIWRFIRDVASGLAYLHSQNPPILHQDIKPDNILILKSGDFVITDFGISRQLRATLRKTAASLNSAGAISYMGPERFSKQYQAVKASDIWSLGASVFELVTNELPFCGMGGSLLKNGADMPELPEDYSETLNMVCQSCMAKAPWERPTAQQLADFASRILDGETSPRVTWKKDEAKEVPVAPKSMRETINYEVQPPQDGQQPHKSAALAGTVAASSPVAAPPAADAPQTPTYPKTEEKKEYFSPAVWILVALAGLIFGIVFKIFI